MGGPVTMSQHLNNRPDKFRHCDDDESLRKRALARYKSDRQAGFRLKALAPDPSLSEITYMHRRIRIRLFAGTRSREGHLAQYDVTQLTVCT
jgi:hypothetical protein